MKLIVTLPLPAAAPAHPTLTTRNPCCPANQLPTLDVPHQRLSSMPRVYAVPSITPLKAQPISQSSAEQQGSGRICKHTAARIHELAAGAALLLPPFSAQHTWCGAACTITSEHTPPSHQQRQTAACSQQNHARPSPALVYLPLPQATGNTRTAPPPRHNMLRCSFHQTPCLQYTLCIGVTSTFCVHQQCHTPPSSPSHLHPRQLTRQPYCQPCTPILQEPYSKPTTCCCC
jgi:hypothetical protein